MLFGFCLFVHPLFRKRHMLVITRLPPQNSNHLQENRGVLLMLDEPQNLNGFVTWKCTVGMSYEFQGWILNEKK